MFGGFWVTDQDGASIHIPSRKGRALIAILAIAPNGERTRSWIQSLLWGRGSSQDSLRKELSKLRSIFSPLEIEIFPREIPRDIVRLDLNCFNIDLLDSNVQLCGDFLEGIGLSHEENFNLWLQEVRANYNTLEVNPGSTSTDTYENTSSTVSTTAPEIIRYASPSRFCIGILPIIANRHFAENEIGIEFSEGVVDRIGKLLLCSGGIDLIDFRSSIVAPNITTNIELTQPQAQLVTKVTRDSRCLIIALQLIVTESRQVICSRRAEFERDSVITLEITNQTIQEFVAETVDEILYKLSRYQSLTPNDGHSALKLVHSAVDGMFQLSYNGLDQARLNLEMASDIHNESVIYAWRAYLANHYIDDPRTTDYQQYRDEAKYCAARALEIDRYNPLTLSLLTQVYAFVLKDLNTAREFMSQAKSLKSDHVMTYDSDALLNLYLGNLQQSRESALKAAQLGKFLSFRYCFFTSLCMIDGLSGNHQSAIEAGERALSLNPIDSDRPYSPTIRYLAANYAKIGKREQARKLMNLLKQSHEKITNKPIEFEHVSPTLEIADFLKIGQKVLLG